MKKKVYNLGLVAFLGLGVLVNAQEAKGKVGVNKATPQATLDVQPSAANLTSTTNEGIIAPKLTKERVSKIATPVEGTLVYVTDVSNGSGATVADITEKGYYYYNGTKWVKSAGGNNTGITNNLYTADGSIKGNREVSLGNNNLFFTGTGNIGIGTESPTSKLDVDGSISVKTRGGNWLLPKNTKVGISGSGQTSDAYYTFLRQTTLSGNVVTIGGSADNFGIYSLSKDRVNNYFDYVLTMNTNTGNVGIATDKPTSKLDVNGNARIRSIATGNPDTDQVLLADTDGNIKKAAVANFKGPKGDTGAAGAQGPAGAAGPKGDKGEKGDSGVAKGINGVTYNESEKSVALGGTLTEATTITQDNKNLTFTTGTGQFIVDGTSNIKGGQYVNIRIVTDADFTLQPTDYMINYKGGGGIVTLPAATDSTGRVVCFYNYAAGDGAALTTKANGNAGAIQPGYGGCIVSDGIEWITKNAY